jgi:hypothetical protein
MAKRPQTAGRDSHVNIPRPNHIVTENYHFEDEGEQRYLAVGMTRNLALVVVVFRSQRAGGRNHAHYLGEKGRGVSTEDGRFTSNAMAG